MFLEAAWTLKNPGEIQGPLQERILTSQTSDGGTVSSRLILIILNALNSTGSSEHFGILKSCTAALAVLGTVAENGHFFRGVASSNDVKDRSYPPIPKSLKIYSIFPLLIATLNLDRI